MKKTSIFSLAVIALSQLVLSSSYGQRANFSGISDGQQICIGDTHPILLSADNDPNGIFRGPGVTNTGNGTATFNPSTAGIGSHDISYWVSQDSFIAVSAGENFSLGIKGDGSLWAWGQNNLGQLGDGSGEESRVPVRIGTDTTWRKIAAGQTYALAIKGNGTLWAWGDNSQNQLGDGSTTPRAQPVQIGTDANWVQIAAGTEHSLGIKSDGTLWVWGRNLYGQLGTGVAITNRTTPFQLGVETN